ncbi:hypothetical protein DKP78_22210, partial [Enterococcus faecium]
EAGGRGADPGSVRVTFGDRTATVRALPDPQHAAGHDAGQRRWRVVLDDTLFAGAKEGDTLMLAPAERPGATGAPIVITLPTFAA